MVKNSSWHHILKHERQLRGWSQADVAARIGSDPKTVSRWEQGLALPLPYFQQRLVDLFGKDAQALGFIAEERENFRDAPKSSDGLPSQKAWKETPRSVHDGEGQVTVGCLPICSISLIIPCLDVRGTCTTCWRSCKIRREPWASLLIG